MCGRFTPVSRDELFAVVQEIERDRAAARGDAASAAPYDVPVVPHAGGVATRAAGTQAAATQARLFDLAPDPVPEPVSADAFPNSVVPVIVEQAGHLALADMDWGYRVAWNSGPVFNTRAETALDTRPNMWTESLRQRRCIVASKGFFEPSATETVISPRSGRPVKRQYRFTRPDGGILFMAGIYEAGCFSVMTCAPNRWVQHVHDRMPVVLRAEELDTWMAGEYTQLFDRSRVELASTPLG